MTFKRSMLVLFFAASLACTVAGETVYFLVGPLPRIWNNRESYVLPLSKEEDINYARYLISRNQLGLLDGDRSILDGDRSIVVAYITTGMDGINRNYLDPRFPGWSWHVSEFIAFAQITIEILDGGPALLENEFDWAHQTATGKYEIGFWSFTVVRELGPTPLYLSILPEGDNLQLYWTGLGTNYVYTLEGRDSLASTNWSALPDASWPQQTNHWTLAKADASARLYRVRAEVFPAIASKEIMGWLRDW